LTQVTTYTELIGGIQAKVERMNMRQADFDELAGFAAGLSGKVFGMLQVRTLRLEKLFDAMRAAGLRLRLEDDPEQEAKMLIRIAQNYNPRQANQARNGHSSSMASSAVLSRVLRPVARLGGKARWRRKSKKAKSDHMKMMVMAREKKRRLKKQRAAKAKRNRAMQEQLGAAA
jgi:hypothetical protein